MNAKDLTLAVLMLYVLILPEIIRVPARKVT